MRGNPVCIKCESEESPIWTNAENLGAVCLNCLKEVNGVKSEDDTGKRGLMRRTRSMRTATSSNPTVAKSKSSTKGIYPKGRGRRALFKKSPQKAPSAVATPVTSDFIFYKGFYYQKGDIVSLVDEDDCIYYAQIRGFLTDQYCQKSAVITWLLPTQESPSPLKCFDPATYIIGPEEDTPRNLDCMEFIMHAPSDYYKSDDTPYPPIYPTLEPGYVWSNLESVRELIYNY